MELETILAKLISFKTLSNDAKEISRAFSWIEKELKGLPLHFKREKSNGHESLLITTKKTKRPKLWLMAHIDVVPAPEKLFTAVVKKGRLYGRGAFDMKFAIACYMRLLKELGKEVKRYDLGVMLVSDEEIGGTNGAGFLAKKGYSAEAMFLPDSGDELALERAAKGAWHFKLTAVGKSGHGSMPWDGKNAINVLMRFLSELQNSVDRLCKENYCDDHWHATMNIGKISGGRATNQIPDHAEALIDVRTPSEREYKTVRAAVEKLLETYPQVALETMMRGSGHETDLSHPYITSFNAVVQKTKGLVPPSVISHGMTDARYFAEKGVPVIITRPTGGDIHSDDEWIDLQKLDEFYGVMKAFAVDVSKL